MSNNDKLCLATLENHFRMACEALGNATQNEENDGFVVLIRELQKNDLATPDDLVGAWIRELDEPVDLETINLSIVLARMLGPEWYVVALHCYLLDLNDDCRSIDETREECPLYGDDLEEVRDYWKRSFDSFDLKRQQEEKAARAWLERVARKAA